MEPQDRPRMRTRGKARTRPKAQTDTEQVRRYQPGDPLMRYCETLKRDVQAVILRVLMPHPDGTWPYLVDLVDLAPNSAGTRRRIVYHDELKPRRDTSPPRSAHPRAAPATIPLAYWRDEHRY